MTGADGSNPVDPSLIKDDACDACGQTLVPVEVPTKTDGRLPGEWEPRYIGDAKKRIAREAIYVGVSMGVYLGFICAVAYAAHFTTFLGTDPAVVGRFSPQVLAYLGGSLGGTMFAMKWLYHSVAKYTWNADRRYWRYFAPALSGGGALCVVLLSKSGALPLFGTDIVQSESGALGISILLGYFSDKVFSALEGFAKQTMPPTQKLDQGGSAPPAVTK